MYTLYRFIMEEEIARNTGATWTIDLIRQESYFFEVKLYWEGFRKEGSGTTTQYSGAEVILSVAGTQCFYPTSWTFVTMNTNDFTQENKDGEYLILKEFKDGKRIMKRSKGTNFLRPYADCTLTFCPLLGDDGIRGPTYEKFFQANMDGYDDSCSIPQYVEQGVDEEGCDSEDET